MIARVMIARVIARSVVSTFSPRLRQVGHRELKAAFDKCPPEKCFSFCQRVRRQLEDILLRWAQLIPHT